VSRTRRGLFGRPVSLPLEAIERNLEPRERIIDVDVGNEPPLDEALS
jgi:hypothetical protein